MKKVLSAFLLILVVAMPAFAELRLWTRHISAAKIINSEANYDDAIFERFKIFVNDDIAAEQAHVDATGKLTLSGGKYTYDGDGETVNNTEKTFDLNANMEIGSTLEYKTDKDFKGEADTGLNGVTATWTFDSMPELNGSGVIPTFTSTKNQLITAVPYIKLTYNSSNQITAIDWAIVKASDTKTPITVDYNSRVVIKLEDNDDNSATLLPKTDFKAGTTISGTITLEEPLTESSIQYFQVSFRNRADENNPFAQEWRFYLPPYPDFLANHVHLWTRHISTAEIKNGEANYDNAAFDRFKIFVVNDDVKAEQAHIDAKGKLTLAGGKYTYDGDGETVNNTEKTFDLKADMKLGKTLNYKMDNDFKGEADTGLNGVTATWTFDSMPELNGEGVIPTFTSTTKQLETAVPYIKLTYDSSNKITAINWAIVKASDTETPITVDYNSRVVINVEDNDDNSTTLLPKTDFKAGTTISGTINLEEPLTENLIQYFEVSFRNRADENNPFAQEWRFYPDSNPNNIGGSNSGCNMGFISIFALIGGALFFKKR